MLENFIGINDRPVSGEFAKTRSNQKAARKQRRQFGDQILGNLYFSKINDLLLYKDTAYALISITQHDWNDGDSHKLLQYTDEQSNSLLIYIEQDKALLDAFQEEELPMGVTMDVSFDKDRPAYSIELGSIKFYLQKHYKGESFNSISNQGNASEQWIYKSTDKKTYIRIVDQSGQIRYYKGIKLQRSDISQKLDLDQAPEKNPEYRTNDWEDKDFV